MLAPWNVTNSVFVTETALEGMREVYPNIGVSGALNLLESARRIQEDIALSLIGREDNKNGAYYLIDEGCEGMFVVVKARKTTGLPFTLCDYYDFSEEQHQRALTIFGMKRGESAPVED